ncbi:MAG: energy-coupled thiamine transporter ThiT, partial [Clostridia bacterium]|nr:energy-coupled thiamine transporter ThiT [Clostridia bacterium]
MTKTKKQLYSLCECGILVAAAVVISFLQIPWFWANGGSISFVAVPLVLIGYRHGVSWGFGACMVYGLVDCIVGGGLGWGIVSVLLDYVLAYGAMGVAGLFRKKGLLSLELGVLFGNLARFAVHFIAGITAWKIAVGDTSEIFGMTFGADASVVYSILYNGSYMLPNLLLSLVAMPLLYPAIKKIEKNHP